MKLSFAEMIVDKIESQQEQIDELKEKFDNFAMQPSILNFGNNGPKFDLKAFESKPYKEGFNDCLNLVINYLQTTYLPANDVDELIDEIKEEAEIFLRDG